LLIVIILELYITSLLKTNFEIINFLQRQYKNKFYTVNYTEKNYTKKSTYVTKKTRKLLKNLRII